MKVKAYDTKEKRYVEVQAVTFHHLEGTPHTIKVEGKEWAVALRFILEWMPDEGDFSKEKYLK